MRRSLIMRWGGPRSETTQFMSEVDRFLTGKSPKCLRLLPLVSYPRLCSDVMGLFKQLMIFGKTGLRGLPTRVTLFLWAFSRRGATGVPPFTTWDSVAGSGRAPIPGNISGRSRPRNNTQCSCSAVGRPLGQQWILGAGLRVGGPGTPPFWRTREELCTVRNSARDLEECVCLLLQDLLWDP